MMNVVSPFAWKCPPRSSQTILGKSFEATTYLTIRERTMAYRESEGSEIGRMYEAAREPIATKGDAPLDDDVSLTFPQKVRRVGIE